MSCRRICHELLEQARFGELGPGSAPHLEHLAECRACRDELGFDRALVRQLRAALAQRIEGASPSPRAWEGVLARMSRPEPRPSRLRAWSMTLVARLRFGSAMAGATLAFLVALNVEIVPVRTSDALDDGSAAAHAGAPSRPLGLADGFPQAAVSVPYAGALEPVVEDRAPTRSYAPGVWSHGPEQLPILGARTNLPPPEPEEPPAREPSADDAWQPLTIRLVPADAAVVHGAAADQASDEPRTSDEQPPTPALREAGTPS
jgi:hypothetical protein